MSSRVTRLKVSMAREGISVMVLSKPEHICYLTGFNATIWSHPAFAILAEDSAKPILLANALRKHKAENTPGVRINHFYGHWFGAEPTASNWPEALQILVAQGSSMGKRIGIERKFISLDFYDALTSALPDAKFVGVDDLLQECRSVKDEDEIANARIAAKIAGAGLAAAKERAHAGGSEYETFFAAKCAMYKLWSKTYPDADIHGFGSLEGGKFDGFDVWVLFGERKFMQTASPTSRRLEDGEAGSVLIWSVINGRHVELEDTVWKGELSNSEKTAIADANEIRGAVVELIRPGLPLSAPYEKACEMLAERGYTKPARIGHNVGLGPHEQGSIDGFAAGSFKAGMIVAIEPNANIRGRFKTQISRTYLVTSESCECLNPESDG
ncbi:xaa-pro aminopeptidase [Fusarium langsethiae]|uniref:Probable Xaa-Pro aminopeptidase P n=1 Tax=Fusarium langsethiae TaxID=179993 RepID=A0A0N1J282_FUSLA|nr:xaa-pro aminopeptidase [Fusarium langsethiae]